MLPTSEVQPLSILALQVQCEDLTEKLIAQGDPLSVQARSTIVTLFNQVLLREQQKTAVAVSLSTLASGLLSSVSIGNLVKTGS